MKNLKTIKGLIIIKKLGLVKDFSLYIVLKLTTTIIILLNFIVENVVLSKVISVIKYINCSFAVIIKPIYIPNRPN